jgi:hypothetical protein
MTRVRPSLITDGYSAAEVHFVTFDFNFCVKVFEGLHKLLLFPSYFQVPDINQNLRNI